MQDRHHALFAAFWRGLGHPIRLRVLEILEAEGPLSVGDLTLRIGIGQGHLSNHLACLRTCGFVERTADGRRALYQVADARVADLLSLGRALLEDHAAGVAACTVVNVGAKSRGAKEAAMVHG